MTKTDKRQRKPKQLAPGTIRKTLTEIAEGLEQALMPRQLSPDEEAGAAVATVQSLRITGLLPW